MSWRERAQKVDAPPAKPSWRDRAQAGPQASAQPATPEQALQQALADGQRKQAAFDASLGESLTGGFSDELGAAMQKLFGAFSEAETPSYSQIRDENKMARERAAAGDKAAAFKGAALGVAPSMALPGGLATAAGVGAVQGVGTSDADLTKGEFAQAGKDALAGGALGTGGAVVGKAIAPLAGKVAQFANAQRVAAVGGNRATNKALMNQGVDLDELGRRIKDSGLLDGIPGMQSAEDIANRAASQVGASGEEVGRAVSALDNAAGGRPVVNQTAPAGAMGLADDVERQIFDPQRGNKAEQLRQLAQEMAGDMVPENAAPKTFQQTWEMKRSLGDRVPWDRQSMPEAKQALAKLYGNVAGDMTSAAQSVSPSLASRFSGANRNYQLDKAAEELASGELAEQLAGAATPVGFATGGNNAVGAISQRLLNPASRRVSQAAAFGADRLNEGTAGLSRGLQNASLPRLIQLLQQLQDDEQAP